MPRAQIAIYKGISSVLIACGRLISPVLWVFAKFSGPGDRCGIFKESTEVWQNFVQNLQEKQVFITAL